MTRALPLAAAACVAVALLAPAPAEAQVRFGLRGGAYFNQPDPFVGVEATFPVARRLRFDPNVEAVFGDEANDVALSADLLYDLQRVADNPVWVGIGPAVIFHDPKPSRLDSETRMGLDLIAGASLGDTPWYTPYLQLKVVVSDRTRAVLAVGVRL